MPLEVLFVLRKSLALYIEVLYLIFAVNTLRIKLLPGDTVDFFTVLSVFRFAAADILYYSLHPGIGCVKLLLCKLQSLLQRDIGRVCGKLGQGLSALRDTGGELRFFRYTLETIILAEIKGGQSAAERFQSSDNVLGRVLFRLLSVRNAVVSKGFQFLQELKPLRL